MFHHIDYVPSGSTGAPLTGVTVRAYLSSDGSLADIYADESSTPFVPANEVTTDNTGMYEFWIADGVYDLRFYVGAALLRTVPKIALGSSKLQDIEVNARDFANFAAAWAFITATGGTLVVSDAQAFSVPLALPLGVSIWCKDDGILNWTGSSSAALIETPITGVYRNRRNRIRIYSAGHAAEIIRVHSAFDADFDIYQADGVGFSSTSTLLHMSADSTAGGDDYTKRNIALCKVRIRSKATVGTLLKTSGLTGSGATYGGSEQAVTLNDFVDLFGHDQYVKGVDLYSWTDNNTFSGFTRLGGSSSNNYIGFDFGAAGGTPAAGVYNNKVVALAVDTFATFTGRKGVYFRTNTKTNVIELLHQDPLAEGGAVVADPDCLSYSVKRAIGATGVIINESRNMVSGGWRSLADDAAIAIDLGGGASAVRAGHFRLSSDDPKANGLFRVKVGSSQACTLIWREDAVNTDYGTGAALTGLTGTDGHVTVRAASDGKVYVENRTGGAINVSLNVEGVTGS